MTAPGGVGKGAEEVPSTARDTTKLLVFPTLERLNVIACPLLTAPEPMVTFGMKKPVALASTTRAAANTRMVKIFRARNMVTPI
jgi:hypothetical protein